MGILLFKLVTRTTPFEDSQGNVEKLGILSAPASVSAKFNGKCKEVAIQGATAASDTSAAGDGHSGWGRLDAEMQLQQLVLTMLVADPSLRPTAEQVLASLDDTEQYIPEKIDMSTFAVPGTHSTGAGAGMKGCCAIS